MSKKAKKSVAVSAEILEAAEAIAKIKGEDIEANTGRYLQEYVMENMSVLIEELNRKDGRGESVKDNAGLEKLGEKS